MVGVVSGDFSQTR